LKFRRSRRPTLPREPVWSFYPKYLFETASKLMRWAALYVGLRMIYLKIKRDPRRYEYMDLALEPVTDDEIETRELFQTEEAHAYVVQVQRLERLRRGQSG
jgi:hypothetical protein